MAQLARLAGSKTRNGTWNGKTREAEISWISREEKSDFCKISVTRDTDNLQFIIISKLNILTYYAYT